MLFVTTSLVKKNKKSVDKKEKIAIGALKYIAIKEAFAMSKEKDLPLYENVLFRKYFTDFYGLTQGAFSTPEMQELFYRLFQAVFELYNTKCNRCLNFKNIETIISSVAGDKEKSFSSKILHTLDNNSPIIDSNVLIGLNLRSSQEPYKDLCNEYLYGNKIKDIFGNKISQTNSGGLIAIAKEERWGANFVELCFNKYNEIINEYKEISKEYKSIASTPITPYKKRTIKKKINELFDIVKDIFKIHYLKTCTSTIDRLENEIEIEKFFNNDDCMEKVFDDKENLGINLKKQLEDISLVKKLEDISLVKKIDFYLWAKFSDKKGKDND